MIFTVFIHFYHIIHAAPLAILRALSRKINHQALEKENNDIAIRKFNGTIGNFLKEVKLGFPKIVCFATCTFSKNML